MSARPTRWLPTTILLASFALVGFWLIRAHDVPWRMFIFGSGSWGIGLWLKLALYHGLVRRLPHDRRSITGVALLNGLVSGITELGVALAFFFWLGRLSLAEIAAFGVGIGAIEASLSIGSRDPLEGTALEGRSKELHTMVEGLGGARGFLFAEVLPAIERWAATGIHVGTRGLTYLTRWTGNPLFLVGALACFVAADGWSYMQLHRGKLATPGGFLRAEIFILAIALAALAGFFVAWRRLGG